MVRLLNYYCGKLVRGRGIVRVCLRPAGHPPPC